MLDPGVFYFFFSFFFFSLEVTWSDSRVSICTAVGLDDQHASTLQCAALQFERNEGGDIFRLGNWDKTVEILDSILYYSLSCPVEHYEVDYKSFKSVDEK